MGRKLDEPDDLFDPEDLDDSQPWLDAEPVPTRRPGSAKTPASNHRRTIEDLHEERALRKMLQELDYDFND